MKVTISTGISTTKDSAQSKKCRLMAKVSRREMRWEVGVAIVKMDGLLFDEWKRDEGKLKEDMKNCYDKMVRVGRGKKGSVSVEIEIED
jgi:hypothetical protein